VQGIRWVSTEIKSKTRHGLLGSCQLILRIRAIPKIRAIHVVFLVLDRRFGELGWVGVLARMGVDLLAQVFPD